ncbi:hypothetical protein TI03_05465, partial [Achromatium sp. WMS1]
SDEDKTKFIIKVLHGETNITSLLKQHLRQISPELQEKSDNNEPYEPRTIASIISLAATYKKQKLANKNKQEKSEGDKHMQSLANQKDELWQEVYQLIGDKKTIAYDKSVSIMIQLQKVAKYENDLPTFKSKITEIRNKYSRLPALMRKIKEKGL